MTNLDVSALIPTYNRKKQVFRAIDSVLAQTVQVGELIVVDDGSTDGTTEAIRSHYGSKVTVISQSNRGVSFARKQAIEAARGEWVAFLDSDDEWLPDRNDAFLKASLEMPKRVAWIFGDTRFVTDEGEVATICAENQLVVDYSAKVFTDPLSQLVWDHARPRACALVSSFIRRSVLMELGCFSEGLRHSEDLLAGLQVASSYSFAAIPAVVTRIYRTGDLEQSSLEYSGRSSADHYRARLIGYAIAARTAGRKPWGRLFADSVRGLCKLRAQQEQPIRRLAFDQFKFGVSVRSVVFLGAAILGPSFFRVGFAVKHSLRAIRGRVFPRELVTGQGQAESRVI